MKLKIIQAKNLTNSYELTTGDSILVVGGNGVGKSFFLKSQVNQHHNKSIKHITHTDFSLSMLNSISFYVDRSGLMPNLMSKVSFGTVLSENLDFDPNSTTVSFNNLNRNGSLFSAGFSNQFGDIDKPFLENFIDINSLLSQNSGNNYEKLEQKFKTFFLTFASKSFENVTRQGAFSETIDNDGALRIKNVLEQFLNGKHITGINPETLKISIKDLDGKEKNLSSLSDGEKKLFSLASALIEEQDQGKIYVWDEPEANFHHRWVKNILGFLIQLLPNSSFIISTHSPILLQQAYLNKKFEVVELLRDEKGISLRKVNLENDYKIREEYGIDYQIDLFKDVNNKTLFVEGITDEKYLRAIGDIKFQLVSADSNSNFKHIRNSLQFSGKIHKNVIFLSDNDDNGFKKILVDDKNPLFDQSKNTHYLTGLSAGDEIESFFLEIIRNDKILRDKVLLCDDIAAALEKYEISKNGKVFNQAELISSLKGKKIIFPDKYEIRKKIASTNDVFSKQQLCDYLLENHQGEVKKVLTPLVHSILGCFDKLSIS